MAQDLRGARWYKSSFSADQGECVEVASNLRGVLAVRDSKNLAGPVLVVTPGEWSAFLAGVKHGTL
ncbi:DUF397 domain-containing protein [Sphaerisporangium corydalis]|uniref:DUF397 domain-containing protein n=1 Tax=Sphaerisporangium corydalis TaxID=1441875 RepID=A0ABV9EKG4_9ACTN|nr:DUF397 domain-containing protein [Sphaerisporangium corydalis]